MKKFYAIGRITKDAELSTIKLGDAEVAVLNFNVAVNNRKATSKRDENGKRIYETQTDYVQCALWREHANAMKPYLVKGRLVAIEGVPELDTWQNREKKIIPVIRLNSPTVELLEGNKSASDEPKPSNDAVPPADNDDELPFTV